MANRSKFAIQLKSVLPSAPDPYRPPAVASHSAQRTDRAAPRWLLFRWHVLPPFILALIATGEPFNHASKGFVVFPLIAIWMDLGPWTHPLNLILTLCLITVTPSLEVAKRFFIHHAFGLRVAQIGLWWLYWLLVAAAFAFGDYRGP